MLPFRRRSWLRRQVLTRVIVHTVNGTSVDGVLAEVARDGVVLRNPRYLDSQEKPRLQGTVFVENAQIDFLQVLTTGPV